MNRCWKLGFALVAAVATAGISSQASANTTWGCSVSDVGVWGAYNGGNTPTIPALSINCGGVTYYANQYYPAQYGSCPSEAVDLVKLWETLATTAFLSGKHLTISFSPNNSNCGSNSITNVDLVN